MEWRAALRNNTIGAMTAEMSVKGGRDYPLELDDPFTRSHLEAGDKQIKKAAKNEKDLDVLEQGLSAMQAVMKNGYQPVHLVSRGLRIIETSFKQANKHMTPY